MIKYIYNTPINYCLSIAILLAMTTTVYSSSLHKTHHTTTTQASQKASITSEIEISKEDIIALSVILGSVAFLIGISIGAMIGDAGHAGPTYFIVPATVFLIVLIPGYMTDDPKGTKGLWKGIQKKLGIEVKASNETSPPSTTNS